MLESWVGPGLMEMELALNFVEEFAQVIDPDVLGPRDWVSVFQDWGREACKKLVSFYIVHVALSCGRASANVVEKVSDLPNALFAMEVS